MAEARAGARRSDTKRSLGPADLNSAFANVPSQAKQIAGREMLRSQRGSEREARNSCRLLRPHYAGHLDIIWRASLILDEIHVMIGVNPKKNSGLFDVGQRVRLIRGSREYMEWFGKNKGAFVVGEFTGPLAATGQGRVQLRAPEASSVPASRRQHHPPRRAPCTTTKTGASYVLAPSEGSRSEPPPWRRQPVACGGAICWRQKFRRRRKVIRRGSFG